MPIRSTTLTESGPFTISDNATLTRTMSFDTTLLIHNHKHQCRLRSADAHVCR